MIACLVYTLFFEQMVTLWTLRKLADFIQEGPDVWYEVFQSEGLVFHDGSNDEKERGRRLHRDFRWVDRPLIV